MSEAPLKHEYEYFPDPTRGRPVSSGSVYVGVANLDPTILANRVDVVLIQQNGNRVTIAPASQPFQTTPGGVIEYQGSPANIRVSGTVSITVQDSVGDTVFYNPLANQHLSTSGTGTNAGGVPLNGNFEIETVPGTPDNWILVPASNATIAIDNTTQSSGFKSLNFTSSSAAGAGRATSDRFDIEDGGQNDIRFSLKSTSINVLNTIDIVYYDASDNTVSLSTVFTEGANTPLSFASFLVTDLAPATAVQCEIVLYGVSSFGAVTTGTTWFDNVSLTNLTGTYKVGITGAVIKTLDVASAVTGITVTNATTGNPARIQGTGEAAGASVVLEATGTNGSVDINATGTEYVKVSGGVAGEDQLIYVNLTTPDIVLTDNNISDVDWIAAGATGYPSSVKAFKVKSHLYSFRAGTNLIHELFLSASQTGTRPTGSDTSPSVYSVSRVTGADTILSKGENIVQASSGDFKYAIDRIGNPLTTGVLVLTIMGFYV